MENNDKTPDKKLPKTYQADSQYIHRKIADMDVLISIGGNIANFNGYVELNQSAVCLWDALKEEHTAAELGEVLVQQFDVVYEQAMEDVMEFLAILQEHDMVVVK